MSQIKVTLSGSVVAEPEQKTVGQSSVLEFPVYVNHSRKNKDSGQYEPTGDVSKIRVTLWREKAEMADIKKGDIVEVVGTLVEKNFTRKDGTEGRSLQTDYIESVVVKFRKDGQQSSASAWDNYVKNAPTVPMVEESAPF